MDKKSAIKAIDDFMRLAKMKPASLGQLSVQNGRAIFSIKKGTASLNTTQRVIDWISAESISRGLNMDAEGKESFTQGDAA